MAKVVKASTKNTSRRFRPALDPEVREQQLISLAVDEAERQLREGTASSQIITHYLELGTSRERLKREKLEEENRLLRAKTEALESQKRVDELYEKAIIAMRRYQGFSEAVEDDGRD